MGNVLIILLIFATFGVLVSGVILMSIGGKMNAKYANKLMFSRVALQASALVMLLAMYALGK